jgi:hypothetical protein
MSRQWCLLVAIDDHGVSAVTAVADTVTLCGLTVRLTARISTNSPSLMSSSDASRTAMSFGSNDATTLDTRVAAPPSRAE